MNIGLLRLPFYSIIVFAPKYLFKYYSKKRTLDTDNCASTKEPIIIIKRNNLCN